MKKEKLPRIVVIAILSLVTALIWAFFDITRAFFKKPETKVEATTLSPLNPNLDLETLNTIQNAKFFEEGQVQENIVQTSPSPTTEPTTPPVSNESPAPEATTSAGNTEGALP